MQGLWLFVLFDDDTTRELIGPTATGALIGCIASLGGVYDEISGRV